MLFHNIAEIIGRTPLLEAHNFGATYAESAHLLCKLECFNPAGSAKDRVALSMLDDAEERGLIKEGATIIEPTSGNTGIGLAALCARRGYRLILTMPDSMSAERRALLAAYGAEIVLTDGTLGMQCAVAKAKELADEMENSFIPSQFDNPANPKAHYITTGPEIWEDADGRIDAFVAGVGTGGTLSGVGRYLKEQNPNCRIVAVEPQTSPLLSKGYAGKHGLQGLGAKFVPENLERSIISDLITVSNEDANKAARTFATTEGLLVGITSGAALHAAAELAKQMPKDARIAVLLPDTGERYLSTPLFKK